MANVESLRKYAIAIGALAVVDLLSIAIVTGFGTAELFTENNANFSVINSSWCAGQGAGTANCDVYDISQTFITGLTIFATFVGVVILALIGKVIVGLYKGDM